MEEHLPVAWSTGHRSQGDGSVTAVKVAALEMAALQVVRIFAEFPVSDVTAEALNLIALVLKE